jgi:hypothetical protein
MNAESRKLATKCKESLQLYQITGTFSYPWLVAIAPIPSIAPNPQCLADNKLTLGRSDRGFMQSEVVC